jgi:hypothetical protein
MADVPACDPAQAGKPRATRKEREQVPDVENYDVTLRTAIFTHPTAAEGLTFLLSGTPISGDRRGGAGLS